MAGSRRPRDIAGTPARRPPQLSDGSVCDSLTASPEPVGVASGYSPGHLGSSIIGRAARGDRRHTCDRHQARPRLVPATTGLRSLQLPRIVALTAPENLASIRVL